MTRFFSMLLAASVLCSPAMAGKDPCKGVKSKSNSFGVTRSLESGDLKLRKTNDAWSMGLGFGHGGGYGAFAATSQEVLTEGTLVEFLMGDGSSIKLTTSAPAGPTFVNIMGIVTSVYELTMSVSVEDATLLTGQTIKAFRVMKGSEEWHQSEVNKGDAKKFQERGQCMVQT
jgi:hypothetical protein